MLAGATFGRSGTGQQKCHIDSFIGMASRGRTTKKITITLPIEDVESVERLVESGQVESVSRYVTEAVAFRRAREDGLAVLERRFGKPPDYALEWARNLVARRLGSPDPTT
jgi:Arc/MetJ-type ribon-helix-helix transcriptional regulator